MREQVLYKTCLVAGIRILAIFIILFTAACTQAQQPQQENLPPLPQEEPLATNLYDPSLYAENIFRNPSLRFGHLGLQEGLSNSVVTSAVQDSRGFLWFGTLDGLNKYDGYQIKVFRHYADDENSISDNIIYQIAVDSTGDLWIGTDDGLNRFNPIMEKFEHFQHNSVDTDSISNNIINAILVDEEDNLWLGTDAGLNYLDPKTGQFTRYIKPDEPVNRFEDLINCLFKDDDGNIWVGSAAGLQILDPRNNKYLNLPGSLEAIFAENSISVNTISQVSSGDIWIGTSNGVYVFSPATLQVNSYLPRELDNRSLSDWQINSIFEDSSGLLWVGTNDGLNLFDSLRENFIQFSHNALDPDSLSGNTIKTIIQDRSGVVWFLSNNGINKMDINNKQFLHYHNQPGQNDSLINNQISTILEDRNGFIWIGTENGLDRFDRRINHFRHFRANVDDPNGLSDDSISAILEDNNGGLWFGTESAGLNFFQPQSETFIHYRSSPVSNNSISNDTVQMILQDQRDLIWVATANGMIDRFDPQTNIFSHFRLVTDDPLSQQQLLVVAMLESADGQIWFGTNAGLYRLNPLTNQIFRYANDEQMKSGLSDNFILSLYQDSAGSIWIGTYGGGLNQLDPFSNQFVVYSQKDGLSNDTVYGILADQNGFLWLSTNFGLSKFSPSAGTFTNFDVDDGLQSNEFNEKAYFESKEGEMFFGGVNGVTAFFPDQIRENPYVPPVVLTSFTIGGVAVNTGIAFEYIQSLNLRWPQNYFDFSFSALSYQQPQQNKYAYFLLGFDDAWNLNEMLRFGRYTNLPGGNYELILVAANENGIWNLDGQKIEINVQPPFWENPLFQWGLIILVLFVSVSIYLLNVRSYHIRNIELEEVVVQRTAEIEQRRQVAEGLKGVLGLLNSDQSLEESLNFIALAANRLSEASHVLILGINKDPITYVTVRSSRIRSQLTEDNEHELKEIDPFINWLTELAKTGKALVLVDLQEFAKQRSETIDLNQPYRSMILQPIVSGNELFGSFVMLYYEQQSFSEEQVDLAIAFADQAALAIGNAQLRERAEQMAVVAERNRLARDLHDAVTQTLFSASLIAEALPKLLESDPAEGQLMLKELRQLTRGALAEMRTLLIELRPAAVAETNLSELLRQLAQAISGRTGMLVEVNSQLPFQLPDDVHISFYRIAQEALNNVLKHAQATIVKILLESHTIEGEKVSVRLKVEDNGIGFKIEDIQSDHFGIGIIRERANLISANLLIESEPGVRTTVQVEWEGSAIHHE